MQSRVQSMYEVATNTGVGMVGSWVITLASVHYVGDKALAATTSVFFCTVWSLVRGYMIRRHFARKSL